MAICDMCKKNYGHEPTRATGYCLIERTAFHVCTECGKKIKELIESEEFKHVKRD